MSAELIQCAPALVEALSRDGEHRAGPRVPTSAGPRLPIIGRSATADAAMKALYAYAVLAASPICFLKVL